MAITSAFQADDVGSIPIRRCITTNRMNDDFRPILGCAADRDSLKSLDIRPARQAVRSRSMSIGDSVISISPRFNPDFSPYLRPYLRPYRITERISSAVMLVLRCFMLRGDLPSSGVFSGTILYRRPSRRVIITPSFCAVSSIAANFRRASEQLYTFISNLQGLL